MKAVVLNGVTRAQDVSISEVEMPVAIPGWVVVKVMAFGLNHSEKILRLDEIRADYIQKPIIPGIECVGYIHDASDTQFKVGQRVVALMGGMGRSFNGSYAEYALLPASHVFTVDCSLPWEQLAAIPETYFTAWGSLFESLLLRSGDSLFIRGGTCSLGYAAIQLAKACGCHVTASARNINKLPTLKRVGADECVLDGGTLRGKVKAGKALELVGPKTLGDTLCCVTRGGIVCNTGILGGEYYLDRFDPIKQIPNGVYLTGFFSNSPTQATIDALFAFISKHDIRPVTGAVYTFDDIRSACIDLDGGLSDGKIVVVHS